MVRQFTRLPALRTTALLVTSALAMSACDSNNDSNDSGGGLIDDSPGAILVPPPQTDVRGIDVLVRDQDGLLIEDVTVLVLNDDVNGDLVDDALETRIAPDGSARISVENSTEEAVVRLEAEKEGFFNNGGRYVLAPDESLDVRIVLTSEASDEPGIRIAGTTGDLSQGSLVVNTSAQDDPENILTTVTVPQGIEIRDVDGAVLDNNLRVSVVYYDSRDEQALAAFPGGFDVNVENAAEIDTPAIEGTVPSETELEPEDDPNRDVTFQSVGFNGIEILDSEGRKADTFVGEIQVTTAIPAGTENPNSGNPLASGDIVPIWSFDTDTANWVYEGTEAVQTSATGGLQITHGADHLSVWNMGFYSETRCEPSLNVTVLGSDNTAVNDVPLITTVLGVGNNVGYRRQERLTSGDVELDDVSTQLELGARFETTSPNVNITSITIDGQPYNGGALDFCAGAANFTVVTDVTAIEVEQALDFSHSISATAQCANAPETGAQALSGVYSYFRSDDGNTYLTGRTNAQGNLTLTGRGNGGGTIYASFNGQESSQTVAAAGGNASFVFDTTCVVTTGGGGQ